MPKVTGKTSTSLKC